MEISEYLDDDADVKVTFSQLGELGVSILKFTLSDSDTEIRVYPEGIHRLLKILQFIETNNLVNDGELI